MRRFFPVLALSVLASVGFSAIFTEDFEASSDGELHGFGGWTADDGMPLNASGNLPTRILNGILLGGDANLRYASHAVNLVGVGGTITLSFDAYGLVADISDGVFSHNSGAGLGSSGTGISVGWIAMNGGGWRFDASALTGNAADFDDVVGGMQGLASFEVVLDRNAGVAFGRWSYFGGTSGETASFAISSGAIDLLSHLVVQQDFRHQTEYTGVEVDNFNLDATAASVPEPMTILLSLSAAGMGFRRLQSRRR